MQSTMSGNKRIIKRISVKAGVIAIWLLLWQLASLAVGSSFLFPSPLTVAARLSELLGQADFYITSAASLARILCGCAAGIVLGTLLGAVTCASRFLGELFTPVLTLIKSTPVASFIILLLVWVKRNNIPCVIAMLMVVPVIWSNVRTGIQKTDADLLEMAKVFHFSFGKKLSKIYVPQVLPYFTAGCTTAIGFSWKAGIAAEVLAIPVRAIGTNLYYSKINLEYADLFAWTVAVVVLSLLLEKVLVFAINRLTAGRRHG